MIPSPTMKKQIVITVTIEAPDEIEDVQPETVLLREAPPDFIEQQRRIRAARAQRVKTLKSEESRGVEAVPRKIEDVKNECPKCGLTFIRLKKHLPACRGRSAHGTKKAGPPLSHCCKATPFEGAPHANGNLYCTLCKRPCFTHLKK